MDLTAEFYLQTIQVVFKEHQLPRGVWVSRGRKIDPSAIETALMTVEGELDDISGIGQTKAAHALTPNIPGARHVHWEQPRRRPLRHLQRPQVARADHAPGARLHPRQRRGLTATHRSPRALPTQWRPQPVPPRSPLLR